VFSITRSQKINQLTDEQSKKSSSPDDNDPRKTRNNAIKKLLIKNLKLAAMIATKEIQLEEAKARSLSSKSQQIMIYSKLYCIYTVITIQ